MLGRSQRSALNQENPTSTRIGASSHHHMHKTPAAKGALGGGGLQHQTGGKSIMTNNNHAGATTTARTTRVLGAKDGNQRTTSEGGQGTSHNGASLLFTGKKASAGPSKQANMPAASTSNKPILLSPPPAPPAHSFRTPSPGLHKFPPMQFSPEAENEADAQLTEEPALHEWDIDEDREVEYAGGSAADYEEPFETGLPDFKTAGFGAALRAMPILSGDHEAWMKLDEQDRLAYRAELDIVDVTGDWDQQDSIFDKSQPIFPVPKRKVLASKSSNLSATALSRTRPASASSASAGHPSIAQAPTAKRKPFGSATSRPATTSTQPNLKSLNSRNTALGTHVPKSRPVTMIASRVSKSSAASSLPPVAERTTAALSSRTRPLQTGLQSAGAGRPRLPNQPERENARAVPLVGDREAERELGLFGIEDLAIDVLEDGIELERDEFRFEDV